jgi:primosomal replication protein N
VNRASLTGAFSRSDALRFSPSGVPILEFSIFHASTQTEGGVARKIELEMDGLAVADIAKALSGIESGTQVKLEGFLAKKGAKNREIVFHATHFELTG